MEKIKNFKNIKSIILFIIYMLLVAFSGITSKIVGKYINFKNAYNIIFYTSFILVIIILYFNILRDNLIKLKDKFWKKIIFSIFILFISLFLQIIVNLLTSQFAGSINQNKFILAKDNSIIFFLIVVIIGPFVEEIIFRGILFNNIKLNNIKISYILVGLSFALYHVPINNFNIREILGVSSLFIFGTLLTYLYDKTKNIYYPIIIHILSNLIAYSLV